MFVIRNVKIPKQTITQISNNRKMKINLILVSKSKFHAFLKIVIILLIDN